MKYYLSLGLLFLCFAVLCSCSQSPVELAENSDSNSLESEEPTTLGESSLFFDGGTAPVSYGPLDVTKAPQELLTLQVEEKNWVLKPWNLMNQGRENEYNRYSEELESTATWAGNYIDTNPATGISAVLKVQPTEKLVYVLEIGEKQVFASEKGDPTASILGRISFRWLDEAHLMIRFLHSSAIYNVETEEIRYLAYPFGVQPPLDRYNLIDRGKAQGFQTAGLNGIDFESHSMIYTVQEESETPSMVIRVLYHYNWETDTATELFRREVAPSNQDSFLTPHVMVHFEDADTVYFSISNFGNRNQLGEDINHMIYRSSISAKTTEKVVTTARDTKCWGILQNGYVLYSQNLSHGGQILVYDLKTGTLVWKEEGVLPGLSQKRYVVYTQGRYRIVLDFETNKKYRFLISDLYEMFPTAKVKPTGGAMITVEYDNQEENRFELDITNALKS